MHDAARRTLVGNWVHSLPDDAYPGPNLDWLHEMVRFFDRYLNGIENGWEREPAMTWFEHDVGRAGGLPRGVAGPVAGGGRVPVPGTTTLSCTWAKARWATPLRRPAGCARSATARPPGPPGPSPGARAGTRTAWPGTSAPTRPAAPPGRASRSAAPLDVIGIPEAVLHVSATMPVATCVVRLSEVSPEGVSALVATGVLNLTHRSSDTDPEPLERDRVEEVTIPLRATGYRFSPGHRVRLTVLTGYWPVLWPSPLPGALRVHHGPATPSRLVLPVLPAAAPLPTRRCSS